MLRRPAAAPDLTVLWPMLKLVYTQQLKATEIGTFAVGPGDSCRRQNFTTAVQTCTGLVPQGMSVLDTSTLTP